MRDRLDRYAAIDGEAFADGIAALPGRGDPGTFVHHDRELLQIRRPIV